MKLWPGILSICLAVPMIATAQTPDKPPGRGYLLIAPLADPSNYNRGVGSSAYIVGGGEGFFYKGLGAGVEFGLLFPWSDFNDYVFALGSANLTYHFVPKAGIRAMDPFLTAGYSIFARAGIDSAMNAGGGADVWLSKSVGVRFEIREYIGNVRAHHVGPRIGILFRSAAPK